MTNDAKVPSRGVCPAGRMKYSYCGGKVAYCLTSDPANDTPIPVRASLSATGLIFPDLNMFKKVNDWKALDNASHGIVGLKVWQAGVQDATINGKIVANFIENYQQAQARKMIIIGYAFGVGGISGTAQADAALALFPAVKATAVTRLVSGVKHTVTTIMNEGHLLVLDLEGNPDGRAMSDVEATDFILRVYQKTGGYPLLYTNLNRKISGLLSKCPRWIASYAGTSPKAGIWQYTDGVNGPQPHSFPGVGNCDINKLLMTYGQLRALAGL